MPSFKTQITTKPVDSLSADLLVVPVWSSSPRIFTGVSGQLAKELSRLSEKSKFPGNWGGAELMASVKAPTGFVGLIGLGDVGDGLVRQCEGLRRALALVLNEARKHLLREVAIVLPDMGGAELVRAALESATLTDYRFAHHQTRLQEEQRTRSLQRLILAVPKAQEKPAREAVQDAERIMQGVTLARDLVNQPASHMSPRVLASYARQIARGSRQVSVKVMNRKQAEANNFSAFLAVARGSEEEPFVIHLIYKPDKKPRKKIFLVGKGVTFDSGGLSLKPASAMESMKIDMAGAASVLGVLAVLPMLNLDIEVHGVIAACENMPSGAAYRPGDVLTAKNGKTIEILNTDAEGRVTLADALSYASEFKPDAVVDLATLTGAVIVALGETYAGLWSNDDGLREGLLAAAEYTGEGLVGLPLPDELKPMIRSRVADVKNTATNHPYAGATTAALFLQEFAGDAPWAHIDLAGPSYAEKPYLPYHVFGGTGYGVRTLIEFLRTQ